MSPVDLEIRSLTVQVELMLCLREECLQSQS